MMESFSLVIPTYNEAKNIKNLCIHLLEVFSKLGIDFEIIVVDDNSPDGTWQIVQALSQKERAIKLIHRMKERGLGTAVVTGWNEAKGEILGVMDGDFQHPPDTIILMIKQMLGDENIDIIVASRNVKDGGVSKWSIWRRSISWMGTSISYFLLPKILARIKDPMSGYFILRKHVIQDVFLNPIGYKILLEVLARGRYKKIVEVPYFFQEREKGGSKAGLKQYLISFIHFFKLSIATKEINKAVKKVFIVLLCIVIAILVFYLLFNILG